MKLEMCESTEWWRLLLDLDDVDDAWHDEATDLFVRMYGESLTAAGHTIVPAGDGRHLCQQWAGANTFTRKDRGVGTFDDVTDTAWAEIERLYDQAENAWEPVVIKRWPVYDEDEDEDDG